MWSDLLADLTLSGLPGRHYRMHFPVCETLTFSIAALSTIKFVQYDHCDSHLQHHVEVELKPSPTLTTQCSPLK